MVEDIFLIFKGSWHAYCHLSKGFPDDKNGKIQMLLIAVFYSLLATDFSVYYI